MEGGAANGVIIFCRNSVIQWQHIAPYIFSFRKTFGILAVNIEQHLTFV